MDNRYLAGLLILCSFGAVAGAQEIPFPLPDGQVGVPYTVDLGEGFQDIQSVPGFEFTYSFAAAGGTLPPGITVRPNGLISGTPSAAGDYAFLVRLTFTISIPGQTFDFTVFYNCQLKITGSAGALLGVEPGAAAFLFPTGAAAGTRQLAVLNRGSQPQSFSAAASTATGGAWLTVTPSSGTVPAFSAAGLAVTANPAGRAAGTYLGQVTISSPGLSQPMVVPVSMTVTGGEPAIQLSQTGFTFRAIAGVAATQSQSFLVLNSGSGAINWTVATSTLSGGAGWLSATPTSGRSDAGSSPPVDVQVNSAGLAAGEYYGQVRVSSPDARNSPQAASVVLQVLPAVENLGPVVLPTGLIFVGTAGGSAPQAQNVRISNFGSRALNFGTATFFETGNNWFTPTLKSGTVAPGQSVNVPVQVSLTGLAVGAYQGELTLRFAEDGSVRRVFVLLIVVPRPASTAGARLAEGCTPTKLYPVFTALGSGFRVTAAWPTPVELLVVDDCGDKMTSGSVVLSFSSGDPALPLTSLRDGRWTGTWQPRNQTTAVTITARATQTTPRLEGTSQIGGGLQPNSTSPVVNAGGVVSAASFAAQAPLAPGSFLAVFGARLASRTSQAASLPLPTELDGTQVLLAGRPLPLHFTSEGQINAVVPYDVPVNTQQQLIVRKGSTFSLPEPVTVEVAQPAIFTSDGSRGIIAGYKPNGQPAQVVTAGDVIVIYCTGLGPVNPPVPAGAAAPVDPLSRTTNEVKLTIGGRDAQVLFAGLAPTFTGVYQVNAIVPADVTPSRTAPVVLTVNNQSSPAVALAVE